MLILHQKIYVIQAELESAGDMVMAALSISPKYNDAYLEAQEVMEDNCLRWEFIYVNTFFF